MKEEFKVKNIGEAVYSILDNAYVYHTPDPNSRIKNFRYPKDDPAYPRGSYMGVFEGGKLIEGGKTWIKIKWYHEYRKEIVSGLIRIRGAKVTEIYPAWVLYEEVTNTPISVIDQALVDENARIAAEQAAREAEELRKLLEGIGNKTTAPKASLGNSLGITKTNADGTTTINYINITIYVGVLVSSLFVFFKFFKPKK